MTLSLFDRPAVLFLPASNPRAIAKARESQADLVILDLEDAVRPDDKESARAEAVEAVAASWPMPVAIRINGVKSDWHAADVAAIIGVKADLIVVPRAEGRDELSFVRNQTGKPVAAMIETARGVIAVGEIAREAAALIAGTNDLAADLRLPRGAGRRPLQMALQTIVMNARAVGIPAFDGVFNGLDDEQGFQLEAAEGKMLGFDGKCLIHPKQIEPCHFAFAPSEEEVARAERLVTAATGGAERFEGEMIERMHVEAAQRIITRALRG